MVARTSFETQVGVPEGGRILQSAALFFVPDVSFLAYLLNPRVAATACNALHADIAPLTLCLLHTLAR